MNTPTEPYHDNGFLSLLQHHRAGLCLSECSRLLAEVVAGVRQTGKAGSITIKLDVKPAPVGIGAVVITDTISEKAPVMAPEVSFWFATDDGRLLKNDPRQREIDFQPRPLQGGLRDDPQQTPTQARTKEA